MLGIEEFTPKTFKSSTAGKVRDYYNHQMADGRSFLLMSSEFTLNAQKKRVGAPDPKKPIWCVLMPDNSGEHTWVIQYSNKEAAASLSADTQTYSKQ